jgi:hypothetical protein
MNFEIQVWHGNRQKLDVFGMQCDFRVVDHGKAPAVSGYLELIPKLIGIVSRNAIASGSIE